MAEHRGTGSIAGFTLIEVLVALAVLAVGFGFAFQAISGSLSWLSRSDSDSALVQVAESLLARVGRDIPLSNGNFEGRAEGGFSWRIEVTPYCDTADASPDQLVGRRVSVNVGRASRQVRLSTLRLTIKGEGL